MKLKHLATLMSFLPLVAWGTEVNLATMTADQVEAACMAEGKTLGSQVSEKSFKGKISPACRTYIESIATKSHRATSDDGDIRIVAGLNIIYIDIDKMIGNKKVTRHHIISGQMAHLNRISAVSLSQDTMKVAVLHNVPLGWDSQEKNLNIPSLTEHLTKEIKIFNATMSGNVSPLSILRSNNINKAKAITFNPNATEVFLINGKTNEILSYDSKADYRMPVDEKKPKSIRKYGPSSSTFRTPSSIDFNGDGSLLILDEKNGQVVSLDTVSNQANWTIDNDTIGLNFVSHLSYNNKNKELIISDNQGNEVSFKKD